MDEKLQKLNISLPLELALIVPSRYEDYRLSSILQSGSMQLLDATIQKITKTPSTLQLQLYVHNFGFSMQGVLFRPKSYQFHQFQVAERYYLYGKIECKSGRCQIIQPKKIKESDVGAIKPIYKTKLRSDIFAKLLHQYINHESLTKEGLPKEIVENILSIHYPKNLPKELTKGQLWALKFVELFCYLTQLKNKRLFFPSLSSHAQNITSWMNSLPFQLTLEQQKAIEDIKRDLLKDVAARRMIVGDVGSGKSMVIFATALMNYPNRSILMAPTTILAKQLYEEAQKYLPNLRIAFVSNKSKPKSLEEFDFIIGTHALLYQELPNATVVMVDEQHRFGTKQRNALQKMLNSGKKKPHYFQFSATPIPRTQAMIESATIDVSLITTTPYKKDITSKVITNKDFAELLKHIKEEIAKKHQVLIIYPLVEESEALEYQSLEEARSYWERNFTNVYVTHGKDKDKEQVLEEFAKKGDILLATTVVEVGISLPRLSTIVIVGAERLGLATLHQLRGRVSRNGLKGYCFLYTKAKESKRLEQFCKTQSGFEIAKLDLKYRQSGDLLHGAMQSGKAFRFVDLAEDEELITQVQKYLYF